jgi:predicted amidohydrolase
METQVQVALAQYFGGREPSGIVEEAGRAGAEIVVFPEMYSNGCARFDPSDCAALARWRDGAQSISGDFVTRCVAAARAHEIYVVATFLEAAEPKPFNSALLIDRRGRPILHHRKVYICNFDSPEMACGRGMNFDVCEIETRSGPVRLGLMICMDREYPEAARSLASKGAEIALVPNCCDLATDRELRRRANSPNARTGV